MIKKKVEQKITDFLKIKHKGASSSDISKNIGHNRITVTKYLEIMQASGKLDSEFFAQARIWSIKEKNNKKKILIVDDEKHVVDLIALSLPDSKYEVYKAYSGLDALDLVHRENPDLIVLDVMMPNIDGYEICRRIKNNVKFKKIPIIMLSAKFQTEDKLRGIEAGANHYMIKPFDPIELEAKIKSILRRVEDDIDSHSLTGIGGQRALDVDLKEKFKEILDNSEKTFFVKKFTIRDFGKLRDDIGFKKSEDLVTLLGRVFLDSIDFEEYFISHIVDESIIITSKVDLKTNIEKKSIDIEKEVIQRVFRLFDFIFYHNNSSIATISVEDYLFTLGNYRFQRKDYESQKKFEEKNTSSKKLLKKDILSILDSDFALDALLKFKQILLNNSSSRVFL